ncbi:MAG: TetR/AcrR family transcriptional regulator [Bacteroidetes bacterium]|nr:TetR/AcrR family transcriptional regulator [Bacteroidota bacterium]
MRIRDENKEASIREKAMEMIVNEGFDGLSMQKLAKAAGVSPATIYIYYKNREDLLTQLYNEVQEKFAEVALRRFNPELSLEEGLWLQWKNRMKFILEYPVYFQFFEQFRNSPLINHKDIQKNEFRENMKNFVLNAIKRGELAKMEPEIFWAVAYGSFYTVVKFHLQEKTMMGGPFKMTDTKMKQMLQMVLKALKP